MRFSGGGDHLSPVEHTEVSFNGSEHPLIPKPAYPWGKRRRISSIDPATGSPVVFQGEAAARIPFERERARIDQLAQRALLGIELTNV